MDDKGGAGVVYVDVGAAWRPIETAPRDVNILIAHHPRNRWRGAVCVGFFHSDYNGHKNVVTEDGRAGWPIDPAPTHWMPLPPPPATPTQDQPHE